MSDSKIQTALRNMAGPFAKRVAPVYRVLDWRWGGNPGHIPDEQQIYASLLEKIDRLRDGVRTVRSGGLEVGMDDDYGHPFIEFALTEFDFEVHGTPLDPEEDE